MRIKRTFKVYTLMGMCFLSLLSCDKDGSFNVFSLEDDKKLGQQVSTEIANNPTQFPLLPETGRNGQNEKAYAHLRRITGNILNSGKVRYKDEFTWQTKI